MNRVYAAALNALREGAESEQSATRAPRAAAARRLIAMSPWIVYSALRFGLFAVVFGVLFAIGLEWWAAAIIATVVAFTVSYIFFAGLRDRIAADLAERRERPPVDADAEAEDTATISEPSPGAERP